ncbi:lipocalin family protein [Nocardia sputorum]|uniref:Lipocalin n=1 Tax=Nocardia sputorum TaxID=2984338 RepID=A0ABM8CSY7_9NOCA|nr:lipocalin [Nocardia sputorum]BDT98061.1 lipocalin [Nocardia sputorum]
MHRRNLLRTSTRLLAGLVSALSATALAAGGASAAPNPLGGPAPVPRLELERYTGTWRQLAAVPQYFNLACARDTQANYALDAAGDIAVRNTCTTWTGTQNEINGTATVNDRETGAQLHVSFPGVPTQDRLDGPTNYIVTALGPDYSWAVVTDPSRISGFVLARAASLDANAWQQVRAAIVAAGQNPCLYLTSPTTGGESRIVPLCAG